jgi:hypothetical protein
MSEGLGWGETPLVDGPAFALRLRQPRSERTKASACAESRCDVGGFVEQRDELQKSWGRATRTRNLAATGGVARKCGSDRGRLAFLTRDWSAPLGALQHSLESVGLHRDSAGHGDQAIGSLIYIRRQTPSPWGGVP